MKKTIITTIILLAFMQIGFTQTTGYFTDPRDGQTYKTVKIGEQVWMAENLNYKTSSGSWCYDDKSSNCDRYGRLYDWQTAKKVCPSGWHLPTKDEYEILIEKFNDNKHVDIFTAYDDLIIGGSSGFSAILGGFRRNKECDYRGINTDCRIWSSTQITQEESRVSKYGSYLYMEDTYFNSFMNFQFWTRDIEGYSYSYSVRCIKD